MNDVVEIYDESGQKIGGTVTVDATGNYNVETTRPLKNGENIYAQLTNTEGKSSNFKVTNNDHKLTPNTVKDGDKEITGKGGNYGDTIIIKDEDGNKIGTGTVDSSGNFTASKDNGEPFQENEVFQVVPVTNEQEGQTSQFIVQKNDADVLTVSIDDLKSTDEKISGEANNADKVIITIDGKEYESDVINGKYDFNLPNGEKLVEGQKVTVTPIKNGYKGEKSETTVGKNDADGINATIDGVNSGDTKVSGTANGADTVKITIDGHDYTSPVDELGNYNFSLPNGAKLSEGQVITVVPIKNNYEGNPANALVNKTNHTVTIKAPTEGQQNVTGTGNPGDTIVIRDNEGKEIGTGKVDKDGKYDVTVDKVLNENDLITVTPKVDGEDGVSTDFIVAGKDENKTGNTVKVTTPDSGSNQLIITEGKPNDKVIIRDSNNVVIGTGNIGDDVKATITLDRPLTEGETIIVTPENQNGDAGQEVVTTVGPSKENNSGNNNSNPSVNIPSVGDKIITGTGKPDSTVTIKDQDGKVVGTGTIDKNGNFSINVGDKIKDGDKYNVIISGSEKPIVVNPGTADDSRIKKGSVVYSLKPIYLYGNKVFKKAY